MFVKLNLESRTLGDTRFDDEDKQTHEGRPQSKFHTRPTAIKAFIA